MLGLQFLKPHASQSGLLDAENCTQRPGRQIIGLVGNNGHPWAWLTRKLFVKRDAVGDPPSFRPAVKAKEAGKFLPRNRHCRLPAFRTGNDKALITVVLLTHGLHAHIAFRKELVNKSQTFQFIELQRNRFV